MNYPNLTSNKEEYFNPIKQQQQQIDLKNIKSNKILKQIINNLRITKFLSIIKYNKAIQNKLDITCKDFQKYSLIEIEIIPVENEFGAFINILNQDEKQYFHIYFDDNKLEAKKNYLDEGDKVNKIKIIIEHPVKSFRALFYSCEYNKSI